MNTPARVVVAFLSLAPSLPALADEHVLFEVQGKDTVLGTIRPFSEQEAILGRLVAGTTVKAAVKSTQKTGPIPTLQLVFDGSAIAGSDVKGRGAVLSPFIVGTTGTYKVVVAGDGTKDGDYQLAVNWTPQKTFSGTGTSAGDTTFAFSAPANSVVSIALTAAAGSSFVPHLLELDGPNSAIVPLTGGGKAKGVRLAVRGDWTLHFKSDAAEGAYKVVVKVAPPNVKKHKVDIRDGALSGAFAGGSVVVGAVIDPGGGSLSLDGTGSPIDGSSVAIPPGALGSPTGVFIAQATVYPLDDGVHPAGPAVEFGPSGTTFPEGLEATVTIPFDAASFPGGTGPMVIYVKDKNGVVAAVPGPYTFGTGTVSFVTSHFSAFLAATNGLRGPPKGLYEWIELTGAATQRLGGSVGIGRGVCEINANDAGKVICEDDRDNIEFDPGQGSPFPPVASTTGTIAVNVNASLLRTSDETFDVIDDASALKIGQFRRGARDDILLLDHGPDSQLGAVALLRVAKSPPTLNTIAGKWHALVWEFKADRPAAGGTTLPLFAIADTGSLVISPTGAATFHFAGGVKRFTDYPSGEWNRENLRGGTVTTTVDTNPETFGFDFDTGSHVTVRAALGGDVLIGNMVGVDRGFGGAASQVGLLILVRQSSGLATSDVVGTYLDGVSALDLHAPDGNPPTEHLGLQWIEEIANDGLSAGRTVRRDGIRLNSAYGSDEQAANFTFDTLSIEPGVGWKVSPAGVFSAAGGNVAGAVRPAQDLLVYVEHDDTALGLAFAVRSKRAVAGSKR